ncbi:hypothetical protein A7D16_04365 [Xanthomonas nasturtii]|nr:hypothetical protein A7D16_04365 [Xanthomonas nasturtii]
MGALDALTRIEMQQLIVQLWRQHGFTLVLVTHDVAEASARPKASARTAFVTLAGAALACPLPGFGTGKP